MANTLHLESLSKRAAGAIGLGSLLAIVLGGAALVFTGVGILLVWRVQSRRQVNTTTTAVYPIVKSFMGSTTTRLTKRRLLDSQSQVGGGGGGGLSSRLSSRLSMSYAPVLPPLPTYNSLNFFRRESKRKQRQRSWVDGGDDFHGPQINKHVRESWFGRDSWLGRVPTLPMLGGSEKGRVQEEEGAVDMKFTGKNEYSQFEQQQQHPRYQQPPRQHPQPPQQVHPAFRAGHRRGQSDGQVIVVQKRQSRNLEGEHMEQGSTLEEDVSRGRSREPGGRAKSQAFALPSLADTDLKYILVSTEQRLRDGQSRSPVKTPQSSPGRGSPIKTPQSFRTGSVRGSIRSHHMPYSPSKKGGFNTSTTQGHSRNGSTCSVGSVANSLIREATAELILPGGAASPSRMKKGSEWEADQEHLRQNPTSSQQSPQHVPHRHPQRIIQQGLLPSPEVSLQQLAEQGAQRNSQRSPQRQNRRKSWESDASSSLSTLYSVGDNEERVDEHNAGHDDPFVVSSQMQRKPSWEAKPAGPRPLTVAFSTLRKSGEFGSAVPSPLHPNSAHHSLRFELPASSVMSEPSKRVQSDEHNREIGEEKEAFSKTPSLTSMVTESETDESEVTEVPVDCTPKGPRPLGNDRSRSPTASPVSPSRERKPEDLSSSPYNEQELLILLSKSSPRRALPMPPTAGEDGSVIPAPLSPRPSKDKLSIPPRKISDSSSYYGDEPRAASPTSTVTGSPSRRSTVRSARGDKTMANSIAELRRMNSIVSSYSAVSAASTAVGAADTDSPTLPGFKGRVVPPRTVNRPSSRHYLNIDRNSPPKNKKNSGKLQHRLSSTRSSRSGPLRQSGLKEFGKENQGLGVRVPRADTHSGLREVTSIHSGNSSPEKVSTTTSVAAVVGVFEGKPTPRAVEDLAAEDKRNPAYRESVESLYDKDGFLVGSPDTRKRVLRI